jgi:Fur family ferric uptake transcriptional regulator
MEHRSASHGDTRLPAGTTAATDEVLDKLRADGCRVTVPRRAVVEALVDAGRDHITADELAARVRFRYPDIHRATVYRTLEILQDAGVVSHVHLGHGPSTFHVGSGLHHHAVCTGCGDLVELPPDALESVGERLKREHGWQLTEQHFALSAVCPACAPD